MTNRENAIQDVAEVININGVTCFDGYFNERENALFYYAVIQRELVYDLRDALKKVERVIDDDGDWFCLACEAYLDTYPPKDSDHEETCATKLALEKVK